MQRRLYRPGQRDVLPDMRLGSVVRMGVVSGWFGMASVLLGACGGSSGGDSPGSKPFQPPSKLMCTPGSSCTCATGRSGTTTCVGDQAMCECEECADITLKDAPRVTACAGEPFGTWRLTALEGGRSQLTLTVGGQAAGSCDMMMTRVGTEVPRVLMALHEGGAAEYFSESGPLSLEYRESCVTSKAPALFCGSSAWTGVSGCKVDCDTCRCQTTTASTNTSDGSWQRTQEALTIAPFGTASAFAYCAAEKKLSVSAEGIYLEFERVSELDAATACAARTAETCLVGQSNCALGACTGGPNCALWKSEGSCLTNSGCSWDADACVGDGAQSCRLQDYGVVPGCGLTTEVLTCQGTPLACAGRAPEECTGACTLNQTGRCTGGTLSCENFIDCPSQCDADCLGAVDCSVFDKLSCPQKDLDYYGIACAWEDPGCSGEPTPCAELSSDQCASVAGCTLAATP